MDHRVGAIDKAAQGSRIVEIAPDDLGRDAGQRRQWRPAADENA